MRLRKRMFGCVAMCLVLAMLLNGCSFHVGNTPKTEKYEDIFIDRMAEVKNQGKYVTKMVTYNYTLPGYGEMQIHVDTSEGHTFEMVEGTSGFQVKDADGNVALTGVITDKDQYKMFTAYANDDYVINGRPFYGLVNEYGSLDLYSYVADCGIDGGLILEATDEKLFRLVAFRGTPIEGALDQASYKGNIEDYEDVTEDEENLDFEKLFDEDTVGFANGYVFDLTEQKIEYHEGYYFKIEGSESVLETSITDEYSAAEAADIMVESLKADSGETPIMDVHSEGIYITGLYDDAFILCFLADGEDVTYILSLRTVDVDNGINIVNSIISDFLRGDATDASVRTEYGQPVEELEDDLLDDLADADSTSDDEYKPHTDKYYKIPSGYTCIYSCDYFDSFAGDEYEYTFNFDADEDLLAFAQGKGTKYLDYELKKVSEIDSSYGKIIICMHGNDGYYRYHALNEDGTVAIDFNSAYSDEIDKKTCEKLIKDVLK